MNKVLILREKLVPSPGSYSRGPAWRWTYSYSVDGANPVEYGTGLTALRRLCRERWPSAEVICAWEQDRPAAGA